MTTREDALHAAICHAVSIMNMSVELVRTEAGRECRDILRKALISYADAALAQSQPPAQAAEAPCAIRYVGGMTKRWKCDACGYEAVHDAHPGCRRPPPAAQAPAEPPSEAVAEVAHWHKFHADLCILLVRAGVTSFGSALDAVRKIIAQRDAALATPSRVAEPADHIPVSPEEARVVDEALGIVELPPIRVDWATHAALAEAAKSRGVVIQAIVRERLVPYAAPPPAERAAGPSGWAIEQGQGWLSIRELESQCGQDFYPDRDPLIFAFLTALAAAPLPSPEAPR